MNPSMDDRRILAEIERRLARDDPELTSLMDALNHQFPGAQDEADEPNSDGERRDWRVKAAVVLAILAVVGMILTAIFSKPPSADDNHVPPNGRLAPAISIQSRAVVTVPDSGVVTAAHLLEQLQA